MPSAPPRCAWSIPNDAPPIGTSRARAVRLPAAGGRGDRLHDRWAARASNRDCQPRAPAWKDGNTMSSNRLWILGASDPEMAAIEGLLRECGERVVYAADERGVRVHPGNAYRIAPLSGDLPWGGDIYLVECDVASPWPSDADGDPMLYR